MIVTIGDEKITAGQFDDIIKGLPAQYQAQARGPAKRQFAEQLVQLKLLAREARRLKLDQKPEVQQQIAFGRENILASAAAQNIMETAKIDPAEIQKYYDAHKSDYSSAQARHILIRFKGSPVPLKEGQQDMTEEQALAKAQEIEKQLKSGGDFAALAKAESADAGSGAQGGELGFFHRGQMVPAFEDATFALQPNQISEPVKSQFGYHIIQLEKLQTTSVDDARADIEKKLKPEIARKDMEELKKTVPVKLDDAFFGPAPAPLPAGHPGQAEPPAVHVK